LNRLETATQSTRYPLAANNDVDATVRLQSKIPDRSYSQYIGQGFIRESALKDKNALRLQLVISRLADPLRERAGGNGSDKLHSQFGI
jgi:hypothetical protein